VKYEPKNENIIDQDISHKDSQLEIKDFEKQMKKRVEQIPEPNKDEKKEFEEHLPSDIKMGIDQSEEDPKDIYMEKESPHESTPKYKQNKPEYLQKPSNAESAGGDYLYNKDRPFDSPRDRLAQPISSYDQSEDSKQQRLSSHSHSKGKLTSSEEKKSEESKKIINVRETMKDKNKKLETLEEPHSEERKKDKDFQREANNDEQLVDSYEFNADEHRFSQSPEEMEALRQRYREFKQEEGKEDQGISKKLDKDMDQREPPEAVDDQDLLDWIAQHQDELNKKSLPKRDQDIINNPDFEKLQGDDHKLTQEEKDNLENKDEDLKKYLDADYQDKGINEEFKDKDNQEQLSEENSEEEEDGGTQNEGSSIPVKSHYLQKFKNQEDIEDNEDVEEPRDPIQKVPEAHPEYVDSEIFDDTKEETKNIDNKDEIPEGIDENTKRSMKKDPQAEGTVEGDIPELKNKPELTRDFTFKKSLNKNQPDDDNKYEIPGYYQQPQNIFIRQGDYPEEEEEFDSIRAKMLSRGYDDETTGKFGKSSQLQGFGGHQKAQEEEGKHSPLGKKSKNKKKKKLKQYLSGERSGSLDKGTKIRNKKAKMSDSKRRKKKEEQLRKQIDRHHPQENLDASNKSVGHIPFDGKVSRIDGDDKAMSPTDEQKDSSLHAFSDGRGKVFGKGNYTMQDDSFNEINQFTNYIQDEEQKAPNGAMHYRGPSMDSEESYFKRLQQKMNPELPLEYRMIDEKYRSPNKLKERISNSQSAIHFQTPDGKMTDHDLMGRKLTGDLRDNHHSSNLGHAKGYYDDTRSTLELDYSLLDPYEELILDKGIMKFHPGFSINYVSRWVQVTKTVIRFYKNYYHSVCNFRRPLAVIPFSAVGKVKSIKVIPPKSNTTKHLGKNPYDQNQFEIILKEEYEALYDLNKRKKEVEELKYELELIQKLEYQDNLRKKYKNYRKQCRLSKSPVPTFRIFMEDNHHEMTKQLSRSHPRLSFSSRFNDDMSRFDTRTNKSQDIIHPVSFNFNNSNLL